MKVNRRSSPPPADRADADLWVHNVTGLAWLTLPNGTSALVGGSGGGGTLNHAALTSNLPFSSSGHTGTPSRFAVFDSGGAAAYLAFPSTGLVSWTGTAWAATTISAPLSLSAGTLAVAVGTTAGTVCAGNDSRLSDSRAPTGSAGGDLAGTYPNPTVADLTITGETAGDILIRGASAWERLAVGSATYMIGVSGGAPAWRSPSNARTDLGLVIGTNVQAWDADLDSLAALGNGLPYRAGGVWSANALGDLAISGASVQVTQARGLRETSGPTTIPMGAIRSGEFLCYLGGVITSASVNVAAYIIASAGFDLVDYGPVTSDIPNIITISAGTDV